MSSRTRRPAPSRSEETSNDTTTSTGEESVDNSFAAWLADLFGFNDSDNDRETDTPTLDNSANDVAIEEEAVTPGLFDDLSSEEQEEVQELVAENVEKRAADAPQVGLAAGTTYTVTAEDMNQSDPWRAIARDNGMSPADLQAFNQQMVETSVGGPTELVETVLAAGAEIYLPSAQELGFAECRRHADSYEEALELWGKMNEGPNVHVLDKARSRASGRIGESYGTKGVDGGRFLTPNPTLAGASSRRSEEINGQTEYRVMWLPDFWKCSLFMHDVVWDAGYQPHQSSNDHYLVAGRLNESQHYEQIDAKNAMPGDCWQRFGGRGSDESHNAVLTSFVEIEDLGNGTERWSMDIVGAESGRAAESEREYIIEKGSDGLVASGPKAGKNVRFFRPRAER